MIDRRSFLRLAGLSALAGALMSHVGRALAWPATAFSADKTASAINELHGRGDFTESGDVHFKAPEIAENGAVVPVTVRYDGEAKRIAVLVDENPQPLAAAFDIPPDALAHVSTRIKMGTSSRVVALVETGDGQLLGAAREVKVTIGGCGG